LEGTKKKIDYRHYVLIGLCLVSLALLIWRYSYSIERVGRAFVELWDSLKLWFGNTFSDVTDKLGIEITANGELLQPIDNGWRDVVSFDFDAFYEKVIRLGFMLIDAENARLYLLWLCDGLFNFALYLMILLPLGYIIKLLAHMIIFSPNKREVGYETVAVRACKWFYRRLVAPVCRFLRSLWAFGRERKNKLYGAILALLWLLNLNVVTLVVELVALYYYFVAIFFLDPISFFGAELIPIPTKLAIDFAVMLSGAPLLFWLGVLWFLFDRSRQRKGLDELRHREAMNCGFAKLLPLVVLICGAMGTKKTTMLTDLALSMVNIYRREALKILFRQDLLFPNFPIQRFEKALNEQIEAHVVYNIPSIDVWIDDLEKREELFGYDVKTFGADRCDELKVVTIYDTLRTYGKAYFIYITAQYIVSNYSIRTDDRIKGEKDCFPLWDSDFFERDPRKQADYEKYSHILDQDIMRLGKTIVKDNRNAGSFGFGIYIDTEKGKSRPNQHGTEGMKRTAEECNQKNDNYAYSDMMCRHAQTMVDNVPFIRKWSDEQRPEKVPAELRDNMDILTIAECSSLELVMPNFIISEMIYDMVYEPMMTWYYKVRNVRKDSFLLIFLVRNVVSLLSRFYWKYYNRYGVFTLTIEKQSGRNFGQNASATATVELHEYYLSTKKIYSNRFSTDCYSEFFRRRQLETDVGINDYSSYAGLRMTDGEMLAQNDHFVIDLHRMFGKRVQSDKSDESARDVEDLLDKYKDSDFDDSKPGSASADSDDPFAF